MSEATGPPAPRDWVGARNFPWPPTLSLAEGDAVVACFTIVGMTRARARDDTPLLKFQLADTYGAVEAHADDAVDALMAALRPGMYVGVRGHLELHEHNRVVRVEEIAPLHVELDDLVLFLPRSARPAELLDAELAALIDSVGDEPLRRLLRALLAPETEVGRGFRLAPAAKQNHHAYLGGLIEHTISVTRVCDLLAAHYGGAIDRDLLIASALLHDVGKIREIGARSAFRIRTRASCLAISCSGCRWWPMRAKRFRN